MSLINQMLRDRQTHGNQPLAPGRSAGGVVKRNAAIVKQLVAGCIGLVFLGVVWVASDLIPGIRAARQHAAGTNQGRQQGEQAPAGSPAKTAGVQESGSRVQRLPADVRGESAPENPKAEALVPAGAASPVPQTVYAALESQNQLSESGREVASPPLNADSARWAPPNALTEEEASLTSFASAEQAYRAGKRALLEESNNELAIKYLQQALALDAGHLLARELLAEVYHKVSRRDAAAMELLREGLERAPGHSVFSKKYARILADRGDYAGAVKVLLYGGLPAIKSDAEALEFLATLYTRLDEPYLAAQTYRNLIANWPRNGNYWFGLGAVLENQGQAGEAVKCYRKALDTNSLRRESKEQATRRLAVLTQLPPG